MSYKVLSAILGVMVVVLLWLVTAPPKDQNQVKAPEVEQLNDQTPPGFPAEFVLPQGAADMNNYTAKFDGRTDLNQQFTTEMTVAAVGAHYDKIFKASGWATQTLVDEPKNKVIAATKGDLTAGLSVSVITGDDGTSQTSVRLSVSQNPAAPAE